MKTKLTPSTLTLLAIAVWAAGAVMPTAVLTAAPAGFATVAPAQAGSFHVFQCGGVAGAEGLAPGQWGFANDAGAPANAWNQCPGALSLWRNGASGAELKAWTMEMTNPVLNFQQVTFNSHSASAGGSVAIAKFCTHWTTNTCPIASGGTAYALLGQGGDGGTTVQHTFSTDTSGKYFRVELSGGSWNGTYVNIGGLNFTMSDAAALSVPAYRGSSLAENEWNSGTRSMNRYATDDGAGIDRFYFLTNNAAGSSETKTVSNPACARVTGGYNSFIPCPAGQELGTTINTQNLPNGANEVRVFSDDASGNRSGPAVVNFKVDNTAPAEPASVDVAGANAAGWRTGNDFDLSWDNDGETVETASQSGIAKSCYAVQPLVAGGIPVVPVCVNGAVDVLSDAQVPSDGSWSADLWTVDRAGNSSDKQQVDLKLDRTVPGKPTGQANGWIGLAELIGGKDQNWSKPSNWQFVTSHFCGYGFSVTQNQADEAPSYINVLGDVTYQQIPAGTPEGINWAHFRAISCAGLVGPSETTPVKVDLTNPHAQVSGIPESGWTNAPGAVDVTATDHLPGSGMNPAPADQTIAEGASIRFDVDGALTSETSGGTASLAGSTLAEGAHALTVRTFDVARNVENQSFNYGVDKTPPTGAFIGGDPSDPTLFRVPVGDALSGVANGTIQYAALDADGNEGAFKPLATKLQDGQLVASFPDTKLPQGNYALRASVQDDATNQSQITKQANGQKMIISNPLRQGVQLSFAGLQRHALCKRAKARTKKAKRRAAKRRAACQKKAALRRVNSDALVTARYGQARLLYGQLSDNNGQPLAGQKLELYEQRAAGDLKLVGSATTDYAGRFGYKAPGGPSRRIVAYWPGSKTQQDVSATMRLAVPTKVKLRVTPRVVHGRSRFTFKGKLFAQDGVSPEGKLVQLQFLNLQGKWQAGPALVRARKDGSFSYRYSIRRAAVSSERIVFRAYVPAETSWAYDPGASPRRTIVHVR